MLDRNRFTSRLFDGLVMLSDRTYGILPFYTHGTLMYFSRSLLLSNFPSLSSRFQFCYLPTFFYYYVDIQLFCSCSLILLFLVPDEFLDIHQLVKDPISYFLPPLLHFQLSNCPNAGLFREWFRSSHLQQNFGYYWILYCHYNFYLFSLSKPSIVIHFTHSRLLSNLESVPLYDFDSSLDPIQLYEDIERTYVTSYKISGNFLELGQ